MDYEIFEKKTTRKWQHMSAEEKQQELQSLLQSNYSKLLPLLMIQQRLKQIL